LDAGVAGGRASQHLLDALAEWRRDDSGELAWPECTSDEPEAVADDVSPLMAMART
jgi:hypothetical protein